GVADAARRRIADGISGGPPDHEHLGAGDHLRRGVRKHTRSWEDAVLADTARSRSILEHGPVGTSELHPPEPSDFGGGTDQLPAVPRPENPDLLVRPAGRD